MRFSFFLLLLATFFVACGNPIKNEEADVSVEAGTETTDTTEATPEPIIPDAVPHTDTEEPTAQSPVGFWVGDFRKKGDPFDDKGIFVDDGFYWNRTNKINIAIDAIVGDSVFGHSVVAGNDRPFRGTKTVEHGIEMYRVVEPGDDR
ncbi:MAG: YARHG domain-containing protein, partial [Bacteroidota bacterium]